MFSVDQFQKIVPNIWCKGNALEMVDFYNSVFKDVKILSSSNYPTEGLPDFQKEFAGKVVAVEFELFGHHLTAINAGPEFTPNPSISFFVSCESENEIDNFFAKLKEGGKVLMPLEEYPFAKRYAWVEDKFNVSWQVIFGNPQGKMMQKIMPSLMFTGALPQAESAVNFYLSFFRNSKLGKVSLYGEQAEPAMKDMVAFADFMIEGSWLGAMDGGSMHNFKFNEGISLSVYCNDQEEIDFYWEKLAGDGGEESVCGWCKDKFGVGWQIMPKNMDDLMKKPNAWQTMMNQKKIVISEY